MSEAQFDAILLVSFGGPEGPDDVLPFLENVLRGRDVPRARMLEVADHYHHFGGRSPINDRNRELMAALQQELREAGLDLPVYWGNRNWHPLLEDTLRDMSRGKVRNALAFITSAFSSYSGCRQYLDDIARARAEVGEAAPAVERLRPFYNHPLFVEACTERLRDAFAQLPAEHRPGAHLLFTAHSVPLAAAKSCDYVEQLDETCRLVTEAMGHGSHRLVYQSRSGPPGQPWLEPDIVDVLREIAAQERSRDVVVMPIGFIADHLEVIYDLDTEALHAARQLGLNMVRAATVGVHPAFVRMIRELIGERMQDTGRRAVGRFGPRPDTCAMDCCPAPRRGPNREPAGPIVPAARSDPDRGP
jgi:ferrochelatase